ncbi:MAG: MFS transporter [Planctomycetes bacterium]|nr:MFS transporter [Planctomycetota bacterium]
MTRPSADPPDPAPVSSPAAAPSSRRSLVVLTSAFFFIFLGAGATQQFIVPYLSERNGWTPPQCSWVLGCVYLSAIVWRLLCAYTVNLLGARLSIILGQLAYTGFVVAMALQGGYPALIFAALVWGWGAAAIWTTGPAQILETSARVRYGSAAGIFFTGVHLGQGLGVLLLGWLLGHCGGPTMLWTAVAISLIANVITLWTPNVEVHRDPPGLLDVVRVFSTPKGAMLSFVLFTSSFGFGIVLSTLSSVVAESKGLGVIAHVTIGFYAARLVVSWISGFLADRIGRIAVMVSGFTLAAVGLALAAASRSPYVLAATALVLGVQAGSNNVAIMALVGDSIEPGRRHLAFGALYAWSNLGIGLTIILGQYLLVWFSKGICFGAFAVAMALCALVSLEIGRRKSERL